MNGYNYLSCALTILLMLLRPATQPFQPIFKKSVLNSGAQVLVPMTHIYVEHLILLVGPGYWNVAIMNDIFLTERIIRR